MRLTIPAGAMVLITTAQGENIAAAIVEAPSKPRPSRAAGKDAA